MASSLQPSLKWWQEEISPSGLTTHVIGWDYAAWATGISFAAEERAAVEAAMDRYMRPYVKMRSAGQPLPEELPVCNKVEACYIPKVRTEVACARGWCCSRFALLLWASLPPTRFDSSPHCQSPLFPPSLHGVHLLYLSLMAHPFLPSPLFPSHASLTCHSPSSLSIPCSLTLLPSSVSACLPRVEQVSFP